MLNFRCLETHPSENGMQDISHKQSGTIDVGRKNVVILMVKNETPDFPVAIFILLLLHCVEKFNK